MSNRRSPGPSDYRGGFLRSPAWFARRARWFRTHARTGTPPSCALCQIQGTSATLELHHLEYTGVTLTGGRWRAMEAHIDLLPLHPACHDLVHRLIDRDTVLSRQRTRRDATLIAIARLQETLHRQEQS
jgi:5-methylcytosine-specific restriction protein A